MYIVLKIGFGSQRWLNCAVAVQEFNISTGINTRFNYVLELINVHISYHNNLFVAVSYLMFAVDIDSRIRLLTKSNATVQMRVYNVYFCQHFLVDI